MKIKKERMRRKDIKRKKRIRKNKKRVELKIITGEKRGAETKKMLVGVNNKQL